MKKNYKFDLSIVVPCFNEEDNIEIVLDEIIACKKKSDLNIEIIVVNDGSTDKTFEKCAKYNKSTYIKLINHKKNKGFGAAFWSGVYAANGKYLIMVPGDGEARFKRVLFATKLLGNVDIILTFFTNKTKRSFSRRFLSKIFTSIINLTFGTKLNYTNGMNIYPTDALKNIECESSGFFFQAEIIVKLLLKNLSFAEVPIKLDSRFNGTSKAVRLSILFIIIKDYISLIRYVYFNKKK